MSQHDVSGLPVVGGQGRPVGVVSDRPGPRASAGTGGEPGDTRQWGHGRPSRGAAAPPGGTRALGQARCNS